MLYLDCQRDPVRLTEHLRGTRESEQKANNKLNSPPPPQSHQIGLFRSGFFRYMCPVCVGRGAGGGVCFECGGGR